MEVGQWSCLFCRRLLPRDPVQVLNVSFDWWVYVVWVVSYLIGMSVCGGFSVMDVCTVVIGCVSYRCGTFGILTQEEHSFSV